MTLTLAGYAGYKITGITLYMKSNKSAGTGSFSMVAGSTTLSEIASSAFSNKNWNGAYTTTYTNVVPAMTNAEYEIGQGENVVIKIAVTTNSLYCQSFAIEYEQVGGEVLAELSNPVISPESCEFNDGEVVYVNIESNEGADIYYTTDGSTPSTENGELYDGEIEITETTTLKAIAVKEGYKNSDVVEAKYTKIIVIEGGVTDVLDRALTGVTGTDYKTWSGKTITSSAVYAGQSAGSNESIQLRSNNSNSGIVTTTSGGKVKKIAIDWNANTDAARKLWVYGKNDAYTSPTELYDNATQGTKIAEIACGTTEFVIEGDYKYIGLRSASGAMYLNSIEITWVPVETLPLTVTSFGWATLYLPKAVVIPTNVKCYAVESVKDGYALLAQIEGVLPAQTAVLVEAPANNYALEVADEANEYNGVNKLCGTLMNQYVNEEAYVLSAPEGKVGLYKAAMTDGVFLNNANKAYLPASAIPASAQGAASYSFSFDWNGTTAIENIEVKNPMADGAIYDLTGRKINSIAVTGIYIINGKKVFVRK